ncbi:hypothetical protein PVAND_013732 [Polypedilum vanderplanki]|uniref:ALMS motif domain-containing protein n=1 Tax=Polypedilum vanderplanki TaxID=319348 RepID=A0A9J6CS84_POLVA|nr:hypothetical protein PVAND_013732 [Polypedilum vanderplanki]
MDSNMKSVLRNYIKKCGEGRGLDKFLRRNSYSSDERETSSSITTSKGRCQTTKSLESLNETDKCTSAKEEAVKHKTPPPKFKEQQKKEEEGGDNKSMEAPKVVVKQSGEKVDKKKSFSYESVIEITLPQQQQTFSHLLPNQSMPEYLNEKSFGEEKIEEPIKPVISTPKSSKIPTHSCKSDRKISPSSDNNESFVSNKQNLMEWDTYMPGYEMDNSQISMQLCNPPLELDDRELGALKTYFQQRGLELPNENLIVVIKNRPDTVSESDKRLEHIRKNKEKWQNIYEKYKEKYQQQQQTSVNFQNIDAQSTPKVTETKETASEPIVMNEKGSQTSLVRSLVKSIQVDSKNGSKSVAQQTTLNTILSQPENQFEMYQNPSEVAESFEFVHGTMQKRKDSKKEESIISETDSNVTEAGSSKNSGLSMSIKNEDISNFDDSLKVAIALLNSLLESKMRPELKRNLAEKVIQKIVQMQTSRSIQTSTLDSSNFYAVSKSSDEKQDDEEKEVKVQKEQHRDKISTPRKKRRDAAIKECLGPMTKSEFSHQSESETINKTISSVSSKSVQKTQLVDFVKREKQSQLKWIEKEIEHLNNLRDLLKRNESSMSINESCPLYENMSLLRAKEKSDKNEFKVPAHPPPPIPPHAEPDVNAYNSHANMKKTKNRSKLETPHSDPNATLNESLASFIDNRSKKFLEKYGQSQKKIYEDVNAYTQPFSNSSRKSSAVQTKHKKHTQMTANKDVQTSTSLASSSVFESSSESISVPINSNSKTTTTHYQPESFTSQIMEEEKKSSNGSSKIKQRIAITQTTDSICRTKPIYEAHGNFGTSSTTATQRVKKLQNDKQLQAHPPSIKYTLTFDKKSKPKIRHYASLPQQSNEYATITKSSKNIYNQMSYSASLNYYYDENKENYDNDILFDDDEEGNEDVDLQKCFNKKRPDIFSRFEQRKKCIEELKKLRALRNEHRAKLLLLTSEKSLEGKLFSSLPDLPLKHTRIFSTKALKLQTKKVVKNLNEVQQKKKEENIKNLRKKTRLMTEIFNKNLQRNVLKGNLNLSNTVNLITK